MLVAGAIGNTLPLADADPSAALVACAAFLGAVLVAALGFLMTGRNEESPRRNDRRFLWAASACAGAGALVCLAGLTFAIEPWELFIAGVLTVASLGSLAAVARRLSAEPKGESTEPRGESPSRWMKALGRRWLAVVTGVVGVLTVGFVAWLFWNGAEPGSAVAAKSYPVYLTCADGVCSVNECVSPQPCGKHAVGRLKEGEMAEITCQTRGGRVPAHSPEGSNIWDKLVDGNYVTDYYIETPKTGEFTPGIRRCPEGVVG